MEKLELVVELKPQMRASTNFYSSFFMDRERKLWVASEG